MRNLVFVAAASFFGCVKGAIPAPASAIIEVPDEITVSWDVDYNGFHDKLGVVAFATLYVYDSETDYPLEHIEVEVLSHSNGVYIIPGQALQLVSYPEASVDPTDEKAIEDACTDADGNFRSDPEWCAWYYDTESGQYYQLSGQYISTSSNYAPNYFVGKTDNRGLLKLYLYVDSLQAQGVGGAEDGGGVVVFQSAQVSASIGVDSASFSIGTGGE
jgi:hypothetical protein